MCMYMYICIFIYTYTYAYIHIYTEQPPHRFISTITTPNAHQARWFSTISPDNHNHWEIIKTIQWSLLRPTKAQAECVSFDSYANLWATGVGSRTAKFGKFRHHALVPTPNAPLSLSNVMCVLLILHLGYVYRVLVQSTFRGLLHWKQIGYQVRT